MITLALGTLQIFSLLVILLAATIILAMISIERYRKCWPWILPIMFLLANGIAFRVTYLADSVDGISNPYVYNLWSEIAHAQNKLTIIIYGTAILSQRWELNKKESPILGFVFKKRG